MRDMQRNIYLIYIIRTIRTFLLLVPILVPFFQENGLTQTQIYLVQSIYAIVIVILEIPSGYFADYFGRKYSMLFGVTFSTIGCAIYSVAYGFAAILPGAITLGVAYSFISGADSALAYDSLLAMSEQKEYRKFEAYSYSLTGISEAVASILGGFLALISLRAPVYAQTIVYLSLIPLVILLKEPPRTKREIKNPFREILNISKYALIDHQEIRWLIFYSATLGTLTYTMVWLTQPYYQLLNIPLGWFGVLWAIQLGFMAIFARAANYYEMRMGKKNAFVSFTVIGVISYMVMGIVPSLITLPFILGFYFVRGVHTPIFQDYVNAIVSSEIRATVLSVKNLAQKLQYAILGPMIGVVVDMYSIQMALVFSGIIYGVMGGVTLWRMYKLEML
ncbi:MFS transporter [Candidatus Uabimicrobium amorphum]|uniref:MFS transporter n=1 Tax=Uabimicrobium amorphum TaxID=2596890 RepID=A0A5S9IW79_UABAM|nr:MFS transporter [Candidatus Uabimicrobium amorphum]BBM87685.1 MFS transporter [Candidatus Uabimicrobium amorphum]